MPASGEVVARPVVRREIARVTDGLDQAPLAARGRQVGHGRFLDLFPIEHPQPDERGTRHGFRGM